MIKPQHALLLSSLLICSNGSAADETTRDEKAGLVNLCPITDKADPTRKMYSFEHAIKKSDSDNFSSGWYHEIPIVDFRYVDSVGTDLD